MKKFLALRPYIKAVIISVLAAIVLDTVINFDDFRRGFDEGRGISSISHIPVRTVLSLPEHLAKFSGIIYKVVFER